MQENIDTIMVGKLEHHPSGLKIPSTIISKYFKEDVIPQEHDIVINALEEWLKDPENQINNDKLVVR